MLFAGACLGWDGGGALVEIYQNFLMVFAVCFLPFKISYYAFCCLSYIMLILCVVTDGWKETEEKEEKGRGVR